MSAFGGPNIIDDGLVLYLDAGNRKSYPGSGTTWFDKSGRGNNGTLINGPTFNTGSLGSVVFDGVNDYIGLGTPSVLNITSNLTINSWVNLTIFPTNSNNSTIYEKGYIVPNEQTFFRFTTDSGVTSLDCGTYNGSNILTKLTLTGSNANLITTGSWNNLVGQYDGSNWNIYVNGNLSSQTLTNQGPVPSAAPISIGAAYIATGYARFLNGRIAITQVYNRALTASEILQNYNATKGRFGL
jgi:hypothetical protein